MIKVIAWEVTQNAIGDPSFLFLFAFIFFIVFVITNRIIHYSMGPIPGIRIKIESKAGLGFHAVPTVPTRSPHHHPLHAGKGTIGSI